MTQPVKGNVGNDSVPLSEPPVLNSKSMPLVVTPAVTATPRGAPPHATQTSSNHSSTNGCDIGYRGANNIGG